MARQLIQKLIGFFLLIFLLNSYLINSAIGLYYETKIQEGEIIVYKRQDYNYSTQTWNSWLYMMYEIVSFKDFSSNEKNETNIQAKRWISDDSIHWEQTPFRIRGDTTSEDLQEEGTIAHLSKVPIYFSVRLDKEDLIIRSDIKLDDYLNEIESTLEVLSEGDDQVMINSTDEGYGINLIITSCGCAIEGGVSKRILNITYTPRGLIQNFYFYEKVNFGANAEAIETKYEQLLVENIDLSQATFENLSTGWEGSFNSASSDPKATSYNTAFILFALLFIVLSRKRLKIL
ncbi:MAG: hypothetical protein ACFE95_16490 [Candidatus Hodarchaeota archaeon]